VSCVKKVNFSDGFIVDNPNSAALPIDLYIVGGFNDKRNLSIRLLRFIVLTLTRLPINFNVKLFVACQSNTRQVAAKNHAYRWPDSKDE
jgi:hypothetical protein